MKENKKKLSKLKCRACEGLEDKLSEDKIRDYLKLLNGWKLVNTHHITKKFNFKNFREALSFTNKVGKLAEKEGHHPDILLKWGAVEVFLFTHALNGLSINDFILAAKIDKIK